MNTPVGTKRLLWAIPLEVAGGVAQQTKEFVRREVKLEEPWMELTLHRKEITQKFTAALPNSFSFAHFHHVATATRRPKNGIFAALILKTLSFHCGVTKHPALRLVFRCLMFASLFVVRCFIFVRSFIICPISHICLPCELRMR
jgi:hypothetical protein